VASKSNHGDSGMPAAGSGSPCSRASSMVVTTNPPPAESPAKTMWDASIPWSSSQRYAESASLTGAG
jgi:hypothetical protein